MFPRRRRRPPLERFHDHRVSLEPLERRLALAIGPAVDEGQVVVTVPADATTVESTAHAGGITLVKRGPGTLVLSAANAHSGGIVVEEGELVIRDAGGLGTGSLAVCAGARVRLDVGTMVVTAGGLDLHAAARLDVGRGRLAVPASADAIAMVTQRVRAAAAAGWSTAAGIGSSAVLDEWRSVGVSSLDGNLVVGWAAVGDTNLDGLVDTLDLANIVAAAEFGSSGPASWGAGDFNHDQVVDVLDLSLFVAVEAYDRGDYRTPPAVSIADATVAEGTVVTTVPRYFRTQGSQILDADGRPVRIAGVNWFGLETSTLRPTACGAAATGA